MLRKLKFVTRFVGLLLVLVMASCSSLYKPLRIDGVEARLALLRKISMKVLPIGMRASSPNGRELFSQYFQPEGQHYKEAIEASTRWTTQIIILGERPPYDIEIYVFKEQRTQEASGRIVYKVTGQDFRIATLVKSQFQKELAQRREDLNIIDDFRVF